MEGDEEDRSDDWPSTSVLTILLELLVVGDIEADRTRLHGSHGFLHLFEGRLESGELEQTHEGGGEVLVALVEAVSLFEEAEQLDTEHTVDEEEDEDDEEDVEGARQDDGESADDPGSRGEPVKH